MIFSCCVHHAMTGARGGTPSWTSPPPPLRPWCPPSYLLRDFSSWRYSGGSISWPPWSLATSLTCGTFTTRVKDCGTWPATRWCPPRCTRWPPWEAMDRLLYLDHPLYKLFLSLNFRG